MKTILRLTILALIFFIIGGHLLSKIKLWRKTKTEVDRMKQEISNLEKKEKDLAEKKEYYQTESFIRRLARDKLGLIGENETVFILPKIPDLSLLSPKGEKYENLTPSQQWQKLFFE